VSRRTAAAAETIFVVSVLSAFTLAAIPTLAEPLLGDHAFRQTQTAYTARIFHENAVDLWHPKLPVLGEPFEVPFEFPLFQVAASVAMDAGFRDDVAARATGLLCFLATALLLFGLVRRVAGRASAMAALVAFLATPFAFAWSRASMIEYLATAGAVGFAWATIAWRDHPRWPIGGLALAAGAVGMLVKPTTAILWILPALGYRPTSPGARTGRRTRAQLTAIVVTPLVAALIWTRHADSVKAASPMTSWLTSDALREWNLGTLDQRVSLDVWHEIGDRLLAYVVGFAGLLFLACAVVAVARSAQRRFWIGVSLAAVLPLLVFTNLYLVHDYYLAAITPASAALIGLGAGFAWSKLPSSPHVRGLAAAVVLVLLLSPLWFARDYWQDARTTERSPETLTLAAEVAARTNPDDRVLVLGLDWNPAVLYYARRRGLMVVERNADASYDLAYEAGYRHVAVRRPDEEDLAPLARWRWIGAVGPHTYVVSDSAREIEAADLRATDGASAARRGTLLRGDVNVDCGAPVRLPAGASGTWLLARGGPARAARIAASRSLAPVPLRHATYVASRLSTGGALTISCAGTDAIELDVVAAAPPSS
jgi:hypothetical protein